MKEHEDYKLREFNKHLLIDEQGKTMLIDTGSPWTISETDFTFMGKKREGMRDMMGVNIGELSELVGTKINVLLGMDILGNYDILINSLEKRIQFHTNINEAAFNTEELDKIDLVTTAPIPLIKIPISEDNSYG